MSANIKRLKARIRSVDSTLHLTKAMQLVAAGKIRKATEQLANSRRYCEAVRTVVGALARSKECADSLYVKGPGEDKPGKTVLIVVAGDRGLAGGYNANAFRLAESVGADEIIPVGRRSVERASHNPEKLSELSFAVTEKFTPEDSKRMATALSERYLAGEISRLEIVSTTYVNIMTQSAERTTLLPLSECVLPESRRMGFKAMRADGSDEPAEEQGRESDFMEFEPDPTEVLGVAVPEYLSSIIYGLVRESFASEIAARRVAMDAATKNGMVMKDNLSLEYNRARQSAITQEIVEIVAGAGK